MFTVFFDNGKGSEMPQDFDTYREAERYAIERINLGYADTYIILSA